MGGQGEREHAAHAVAGRGLGEAGPLPDDGEVGHLAAPARGRDVHAGALAEGGLHGVEVVGDGVAAGVRVEGAARREGDAGVVDAGQGRARAHEHAHRPVEGVRVGAERAGQVGGTETERLGGLRHVLTRHRPPPGTRCTAGTSVSLVKLDRHTLGHTPV